jgi:hypothetical protein
MGLQAAERKINDVRQILNELTGRDGLLADHLLLDACERLLCGAIRDMGLQPSPPALETAVVYPAGYEPR